MAGVLSKIVKTDKETKEHLESIDTTLQSLYDLQLSTEKREAKDAKRKAQKEKRSAGDNFLDKLKLNDKDKKKAKKSLLESLSELFKNIGGGLKGGLGGLLKLLFGKDGPIAKIITGAFSTLFSATGAVMKGMTRAIGAVLGSPWFWKAAAAAGIALGAFKGVRTIAENLDVQQRGKGRTKDGDVFIATDLSAMMAAEAELFRKNNPRGNFYDTGRTKLYNNAYIAMAEAKSVNDDLWQAEQNLKLRQKQAKDMSLTERERLSAQNKARHLLKTVQTLTAKKEAADKKVTEAYTKLQKTRTELFATQIDAGRRAITQVPEEYREVLKRYTNLGIWSSFGGAAERHLDLYQARQSGGPLTVPGSGSGDKVPMMLPQGSFVMNRNAAAMGFQSGGMIPTLLEPGEHVYGPGQWNASHVMQNNSIPRFQTGGIVQATHADTGTGWSVGKDEKGRPSVFSKQAAEAFKTMMDNSGGAVKTSDITSSTRSPAKNVAVGGATNSNHLRGNAVDIHGSSKVWMKANGMKYGWKNLVYSGHDGHFDFLKGGALPVQETNEHTSDSESKDGGGGAAGFIQSIAAMGGDVGKFIGKALGSMGEMFGPEAGSLINAILGGISLGGGDDPTSPDGTSPTGTGPVDMGADTNAKLMSAAKLAMDAGFTKEQAKIMAAIAGGESSFNNRALNDNRATGDKSYGLWQINMIDSMGPARRKQFGIGSNEELYDPATNARAAKAIFDSQGFGAWGAYKDGNASKYMNAAQALQLAQGGRVGRAPQMNVYKASQQMATRRHLARSNKNNIQVIPVPSKGKPSYNANPGAQNQPPDLTAYPSNAMAMDLAYRTSIGGVF